MEIEFQTSIFTHVRVVLIIAVYKQIYLMRKIYESTVGLFNCGFVDTNLHLQQ